MNIKTSKTLVDVLKHLYKLADDFPYSQLALCLDQKNLFDLIRVFGGQTLYIPTTSELTQLIQYCIVEEIGNYKDAVAINSEALNGFTEARYNRILNQLNKGSKPTQRKKRNSRGQSEDEPRESGERPKSEGIEKS